MSLSKEEIVERQKTLFADAETVQKRIIDLEKALEEKPIIIPIQLQKAPPHFGFM